jgi:murein DD-endopeptidase MepM/ murein hydrolase activator NlpD
MMRLSINLPAKRRLDINLIKSRSGLDEKPLLPDLGKVRRLRNGNKISRVFRHFFEHKKIKRLFGVNIVAVAFASSLSPTTFRADSVPEIVLSPQQAVLTTEKGLRYPLDSIRITQGYKIYHPGIDFDGDVGDAVYPIMEGVVSDIQHSRYAYGNAVLLDHGNYITSLYAHLSAIYVDVGQVVTSADLVGAVGSTGYSTGDHLHLEVRENGYQVNPLIYLP